MNRRTLITGLVSLVAAPAIVRASNLMRVKSMIPASPIITVEIHLVEYTPLSLEEIKDYLFKAVAESFGIPEQLIRSDHGRFDHQFVLANAQNIFDTDLAMKRITEQRVYSIGDE